jgi:hypothetical protein
VSYPSLVESHKSWLGSSTSLRSRSSGKISNTTMPGVFTDGARIVSPSVLCELPSPLALEDEAMYRLICSGDREYLRPILGETNGINSHVSCRQKKGCGGGASLRGKPLGSTEAAGLQDIYDLREPDEPDEPEVAVSKPSARGGRLQQVSKDGVVAGHGASLAVHTESLSYDMHVRLGHPCRCQLCSFCQMFSMPRSGFGVMSSPKQWTPFCALSKYEA